MNWLQLAQEVVEGKVISNLEASLILNCEDDDLLLLMHGAFHIRKHYYGKKVKLNMIMNAKSGNCSENCGYCSQSSISTAEIESIPLFRKKKF